MTLNGDNYNAQTVVIVVYAVRTAWYVFLFVKKKRFSATKFKILKWPDRSESLMADNKPVIVIIIVIIVSDNVGT